MTSQGSTKKKIRKKDAQPLEKESGASATDTSTTDTSSTSTPQTIDASSQAAPVPAAPTAAVGAAATPRDVALEETRVAQLAGGAVVLVIVGAVAGGVILGPATGVLVLAAGAFVAVIALFWSSLRTLLGETPLSGADAYALGAARAEEEQKRAVLRALKDLEFERSVGKISEDDYRRLVAHYRAEAKRLLRMLDEESQPMRDRADALISARLKSAGIGQTTADVFRQPAKTASDLAREAHTEEVGRELRDAASKAPSAAAPADGERVEAAQLHDLATAAKKVDAAPEAVHQPPDEEDSAEGDNDDTKEARNA